MKEKNARFNKQTDKGTYSDKVHHGEVKRTARFSNDAPAALGQNLAAEKGVSGAKSILTGQFSKKK